MTPIRSKKELEIILSKLKGFKRAKVRNEQYETPSSIAAEVLWKAYFNKHVQGKVIADLGCGNGILGIGCLLLGAKRVILVDNDPESLDICNDNLLPLKSESIPIREMEIIRSDIQNFNCKVDTVIMNPPFGTKKKHADREFLIKAFEVSNVIYSFHKYNTGEYITQFSEKKGFKVIERFDFNFMLRNTMTYHRSDKKYIKVSCFVFERK